MLWTARPEGLSCASTLTLYQKRQGRNQGHFLHSLDPLNLTTNQPNMPDPTRGRKGRAGYIGKESQREDSSKRLLPLAVNFTLLFQIKDWHQQGLMPQVLRYHVVACHQLPLESLKQTPNVTSLQGEPIVVSISQVRHTTSRRQLLFLGPLFPVL